MTTTRTRSRPIAPEATTPAATYDATELARNLQRHASRAGEPLSDAAAEEQATRTIRQWQARDEAAGVPGGFSRLVRRAPRPPALTGLTAHQRRTGIVERDDGTSVRLTHDERALGGTYRVIHGRLMLPLADEDRRKLPDGNFDPEAPKTYFAEMGDEVLLSHGDAARMLDADVIEELGADPSRCGKLWAPPAPPAGGMASWARALELNERSRAEATARARAAAAGPVPR